MIFFFKLILFHLLFKEDGYGSRFCKNQTREYIYIFFSNLFNTDIGKMYTLFYNLYMEYMFVVSMYFRFTWLFALGTYNFLILTNFSILKYTIVHSYAKLIVFYGVRGKKSTKVLNRITIRQIKQKIDAIVAAHTGVETLQLLYVPVVDATISSQSVNMIRYGWRQSIAVKEDSDSICVDVYSYPVWALLGAFVGVKYKCTRLLPHNRDLIRWKYSYCLNG